MTAHAGEIDGFHLAYAWGGGPFVARNATNGCALLARARRLQQAPSRGIGLPETNAVAVEYFARLGITAERHVTRMWLGTPPSWRPDTIFGVFNFGVG